MLRTILLSLVIAAALCRGVHAADDMVDPNNDPISHVDAQPADRADTADKPDELPGQSGVFIPPPALDNDECKFLRERADAGDPAMQCLYGLALINGSAGRIDKKTGLDWLRKSAENGDLRGGFEYGKALYQGTAGKTEPLKALGWLMPAAQAGNHEAAYYLGATLLAGEGIKHDTVEGEKWLRIAANSGIAGAQADLGIAFFSGLGGLKKNYGEARRWFTLAAKQGNGDACNKLGVIYQNGYGVIPDPERAILWFNMGANLGDQYAQYNLATCYMNGGWVARDYAQAARWHEQAAMRGNADSQYYLGCFYAEGIGVKKDMGRAREWLTLAERGGHEGSGELLERLWDLENDSSVSAPPAPVRVNAGPLLKEFVRTPLQAVDKGRVVLLDVGDEISVSPDEEGGGSYLTVPGSPGVIYCQGSFGNLIQPGMVIKGTGGGFSGLPGFIRLENVCEATPDDINSCEEVGGRKPAKPANAETRNQNDSDDADTDDDAPAPESAEPADTNAAPREDEADA